MPDESVVNDTQGDSMLQGAFGTDIFRSVLFLPASHGGASKEK